MHGLQVPDSSTGSTIEGIDAERVSAWMRDTIDGPEAAVHLRPHRRRPLQPDLPGHRRRRSRLRPAAAAGQPRPPHRPRHEPRAHGDQRPRADRTSPSPAPSDLCTDPTVNGAPFYVMSFVEGHIVRDERAAGPARPRRPGAGRPTPSSTRSPASTPSTSTRWDSATSPGGTGTSPASSSGGTASSPSRRWTASRARPSSTGCTTCCAPGSPTNRRRPSSTATTGWTTPCSTTTATCSPSSTGRSARWVTRWPTSACSSSTGPSPRTATRR